eukprot:3934894-Rhodomonas_salina.6
MSVDEDQGVRRQASSVSSGRVLSIDERHRAQGCRCRASAVVIKGWGGLDVEGHLSITSGSVLVLGVALFPHAGSCALRGADRRHWQGGRRQDRGG